jgi:anthranilate synthase component I
VTPPPTWGVTWPSLGEFRELALDRRVIPVVRRLLGDDLTPIDIYRRLGADRPGTFILESAEFGGQWSRWSFIGVRSRATLTVSAAEGAGRGRARWLGDVPAGIPTEGDVLEVLGAALEALHTPEIPGLPPLTGGFVGVLGWDVLRHWEPTLRALAPEEINVPELGLCLATDLVAVDHVDGSVWLIANAINFDDSDERVDEAHADAVARVDEMEATLLEPRASLAAVLDPDAPEPDLRFRTRREDFLAAVRTAKEAIRDGEVFQVVLSQRLELDCPADPFDVYRVLRTVNPSPYMYYVRLTDAAGTDFSVVGSSPETLVKVEGREVTTFPIAGSRPRGATPAADKTLADELLADPKELAEHLMLVDLSRNDLAKVCRPETVELVEFMVIKRYSHIMHIASTVIGHLRDGATALGTLVATFPAGTLSGAPKPRAIELIDQLEPARRGIYGGTVGYFDFAGNMDMAIAIRTALVRDGVALVQAGGGLVADSVPELEYAESRDKAAAAVRAVQIAARLRPAGR